jgi:hypothetical protein
MNADSETIDYVTIDSIEWATGHVRPRMSLEEKRAKHRVHQRQFVVRQRQRLERLRHELRCHKLQFQQLQAVQEAALLACENAVLREQLASESLVTGRRNRLNIWDLFPTRPECTQVTTDSIPARKESFAPDTANSVECAVQLTTDVNVGSSHSLSPSKRDDLTPLAWSPTTACAVKMAYPLVSIHDEVYVLLAKGCTSI